MATDTRDDELRERARTRIEERRRLRLRAATFALGMAVLVPVWVVSEYLSAGGWPQRLSSNGNPGDWSPWLIWVALAWGFWVVLSVVATRLRRPPTDGEVERELDRLAARS